MKETYNGWKNRQTWNVVLWLENDESLYMLAVSYAKRKAQAGRIPTYLGFARWAGLVNDRTPDGISWTGTRLDYPTLNNLLASYASH